MFDFFLNFFLRNCFTFLNLFYFFIKNLIAWGGGGSGFPEFLESSNFEKNTSTFFLFCKIVLRLTIFS